MQELLGRIARLDPSASLGLRVIACFDELIIGNVNTRALLAAAASLAGCVAGFSQQEPSRTMRVTSRGQLADDLVDADMSSFATAMPGPQLKVWLERTGDALANDAIILERLAMAVRLRHGQARPDYDNRRDLGLLLDADVSVHVRYTAATALGLALDQQYQVIAAPLFAVWTTHPEGPEDVIATPYGPIHALVIPAQSTELQASPVGAGAATGIEHLPHSFRSALLALRLCNPPKTPIVTAEDYGGLVNLLARTVNDDPQPDVDLLVSLSSHTWAADTLDAVVRTASVRQAAREIGIHHSTMQARIDTMLSVLGFDPFEGFGRTRLCTAYLLWRLRSSRVLELPAPVNQSTLGTQNR